MIDKSTPTPWKVFNKNGVISVMTLDHKEVVHWMGFDSSDFPPAVVANADLIVRAVNRDHLFGELVTFLKPLADHADYLEQHFELAKHPDAVDPETQLALPDDLSLADCQRIRTLLVKVESL